MAKPEVCNEKVITEGDFARLFHRYRNSNFLFILTNICSDYIILISNKCLLMEGE
ncbi:MAG: hypothetical protein ACI4EI_04250 [Muricoprocola sp.]